MECVFDSSAVAWCCNVPRHAFAIQMRAIQQSGKRWRIVKFGKYRVMKRTGLLCFVLTVYLTILVACVSGFHPTATPTFAPRTPEPTRTPLYRATVITSADYGQTLQLFVGDIFEIEKVSGDNLPTTIGDTQVLQFLPSASDATSRKERYKAIAPGTATLSSIVSVPCPNRPIGCQPPISFIYVTVDVRLP